MRLKTYKYSAAQGLQTIKTKTALLLSTAVLAVGGTGGMAAIVFGTAHASPMGSTLNYTQIPFTSSELANWTTDRTTPSGGYNSVSFGGRSNVLEENVNTSNQTNPSFYNYEGLKRDISGSAAVKADLYVDSSWTGSDVRAGIWGVGEDSSQNVTAYPIVEWTNNGDNGYVGWRTFDDQNGGWINLPNVSYNTDGWNTVSMVYNSTTTAFDFTINGQAAGSSVATGSTDLSGVILNNHNSGSGANYSVHWSNLATGVFADLTSADQCKDGGWMLSSDSNGNAFKNQGLCVSWVQHNVNGHGTPANGKH